MDSLKFDNSISKLDREKALESREGYYQTQFETLERYGGMNTIDSNHIFQVHQPINFILRLYYLVISVQFLFIVVYTVIFKVSFKLF